MQACFYGIHAWFVAGWTVWPLKCCPVSITMLTDGTLYSTENSNVIVAIKCHKHIGRLENHSYMETKCSF